MFKLFEPDGLFARGMSHVYYLVVVNVLWLVCSLPVVTFGASSAALYSCLFRLSRGDDTRPVRRFFAAFAENGKRATAAWLAVLAALVLLIFDWYFASVTDQPVWKIIAVGGLQVVGMVCTFLFALVARYDNLWYVHLKNALLLAVMYLPVSVVIVVINLIPFLVWLLLPELFNRIMLLWVFLSGGVIAYVNGKMLRRIFERHITAPQDEQQGG